MVDEYGTQLLPSFVSVVHADAGSIDSQPTVSDSNGGYIPTTLTATRPTVSNADFSESKWYKDGTLITETYNPQTSSIVNVVDKSIVGGTWTNYDTGITGVNGSQWRCFGMASNGSVMVAVGGVHDGTGQGANGDGSKKALYSTDGVNWNFTIYPMNNTEIVPGVYEVLLTICSFVQWKHGRQPIHYL